MFDIEKNFNFNLTPGKKLETTLAINSGKPLISIITAYYNVRKFIEETANSVFNQTFPYWEWIIVNDGSTEEGTIEFLNEFAKRDKRIIVYHKDNEGLPKTRDYAIERSSTNLLYILDPDDLVDPTFLECGYWTLITNPKATWTYSNHVGFGGMKYTFSTDFDLNREKKENIICGSTIVRKNSLLEVGGYSQAQRGVYEDWHLWLRLLAKGYYPIKMNFYGFWYRRREGVLHSINKNKKSKNIALKVMKSLAKEIKVKNSDYINFPISTNISENIMPKAFEWNRKPIYEKGKKKNLLFILPWFTIGGADNFNLELISKLNKEEYNITIITTEYSKYILRQEFEKHATIFDLTSFLKQKDWAGFIHYLIKSRNIDLIFLSNSFYGYYVTPWLKAEFPNVKFVDYLHAEDWSWRNGGYPRDSIAISNILDMTYTCTYHLEEIMFSKMSRENRNVKTIYIGVDEKKYSPNLKLTKKDDAELIKLKDKYSNKKIMLFVCRIVELKRPIFILKVLEKLLLFGKDYVLFVVGDGEQLSEMKDVAKKLNLLDNIKFFGMLKDFQYLYKMANVTLITSLTEGVTLTTYESLSMGVPVVTADVGGQKELISKNCGRVIKAYQTIEKDLFNRNYNEKEINEYANAIIDIIEDKNYDKIKKACRENIVKNYTIDNMVKALSSEFNKLINSNKIIEFDDKTLAENYLNIFLVKYPFYLKKSSGKWTLKQRIIDKLWSFWLWRNFIAFCRKMGLIKLKKKIFNDY